MLSVTFSINISILTPTNNTIEIIPTEVYNTYDQRDRDWVAGVYHEIFYIYSDLNPYSGSSLLQ